MVVATKPEFETLSHLKNSLGTNVQPELLVSFSLPCKSAENLTVNVQCRAIHIRRFSQNKYLIGLKFLQLNQVTTSAIQRHIISNLS